MIFGTCEVCGQRRAQGTYTTYWNYLFEILENVKEQSKVITPTHIATDKDHIIPSRYLPNLMSKMLIFFTKILCNKTQWISFCDQVAISIANEKKKNRFTPTCKVMRELGIWFWVHELTLDRPLEP
jgi:hypothetical protein